MKNGTEVRIRGFFRAQIVDKKTGKIVGDSKWRRNTITRIGLNNMAAACAISHSDRLPVSLAVIASSSAGAINSTVVSLVGTILSMQSISVDGQRSIINYGTGQVTCSFAGADHTNTHTIGAIGLHGTNNASQSLLAGATFASSQWNSNQNINASYQLRFS